MWRITTCRSFYTNFYILSGVILWKEIEKENIKKRGIGMIDIDKDIIMGGVTMHDLRPYKEAQLTPLMKWSIIIGNIIFTIICLIAMPIITFA